MHAHMRARSYFPAFLPMIKVTTNLTSIKAKIFVKRRNVFGRNSDRSDLWHARSIDSVTRDRRGRENISRDISPNETTKGKKAQSNVKRGEGEGEENGSTRVSVTRAPSDKLADAL